MAAVLPFGFNSLITPLTSNVSRLAPSAAPFRCADCLQPATPNDSARARAKIPTAFHIDGRNFARGCAMWQELCGGARVLVRFASKRKACGAGEAAEKAT